MKKCHLVPQHSKTKWKVTGYSHSDTCIWLLPLRYRVFIRKVYLYLYILLSHGVFLAWELCITAKSKISWGSLQFSLLNNSFISEFLQNFANMPVREKVVKILAYIMQSSNHLVQCPKLTCLAKPPSNININFYKKTCSQLPAKTAIEIDLCVSAVPQTASFVE